MITRPWRVAIFLSFAAGLNYADRTALSSVIPPLRTDLGITDAQIGLAGMLFLWCYAIVSPFAGNIADKFSRSKIIVLTLVAWSLVTLGTGFVTGVTSLLVLRAVLGLAECFYLPAAGALLGDHHGPATLGKAVGLHMLGLNLGLVLGGASAGWIAQHYGWRLGFWGLGGLGLVLACFAPWLLGADPVRAKPKLTQTSRGVAAEAWHYLLRTPTFYCLLIGAMVAGVASWIFLTWLPLYFTESFGMQLGAAGLAGVAIYKGPVFIGIAIGGWLSDKTIQRNIRGRALIKALSYILSAPFLFLFLWAPSFGVVAVLMILSAIIRAIGAPSEHPIICEIVPPQYRSTAIGILNCCGSAAGGVGVLLAGIFKKDLGLNAIFSASSVLYLLAGFVIYYAYRVLMARDMARSEAFINGPENLSVAT